MSTANSYLRNPMFDALFIAGIFSLAVVCGLLVLNNNQLFMLIFTLDLWLLGYHHVVATYARFTDQKTWQDHRRLILYLPWLVIAGVTLLAFTVGIWSIATIYLHWQFFHYLRQSDGISKAFNSRSQDKTFIFQRLNRIAMYFIPLACFLNLSLRDTTEFLWMPVFILPIPHTLIYIVDGIAAVVFLLWLANNLLALKHNRITPSYFFYMLSHFCVFALAYVFITQINYGWLVINIWHNFQYIAFVWLFNTNRFKNGVEKNNLFLSYLSQPKRFLMYFAVFLILTTTFYKLVDWSITLVQPHVAIPIVVVVYQTLNFHHYIVDSLIWKLRKTSVSSKIVNT